MKTLLCLALFGVCATLHAAEWLTNFEQALAEAKQSNKPILIDFTGSDWCPWCIRLRSEVFDQPEFESWAQDNVVLFEADFPKRVAQDDNTKAINEALMEKYGVRGFPTVVLISADGMEKGRTGYEPGGPTVYIKNLESIIK